MNLVSNVANRLGRKLAKFLNRRRGCYKTFAVSDTATLRALLRPGDVLLVEGDQRISVAIKYLTQSTWSHACLYVGNALAQEDDTDPPVLVEADICAGVIAVPLSRYAHLNTRICRPIGLREEDAERLISYVVSRVGDEYDLRNVFDLARYLLPEPPVPVRFRRRMLALGSGEPTRAICSTLVAQAFQSICYPIMPRRLSKSKAEGADYLSNDDELLRVRHFSHFTPRDFDVSPYFEIIKPVQQSHFDYRKLHWLFDADTVISPGCQGQAVTIEDEIS